MFQQFGTHPQFGGSMQNALAIFLIILGVGQISATGWRLVGVSLVGSNRWAGYALGLGFVVTGGLLLRPALWMWLLVLPAALLAGAGLLWGASTFAPVVPPETLFLAEHPAHGGCQPVEIPDGDFSGPGLLLHPPAGVPAQRAAICIVPGAGDTKTFFKWRLVKALLAAGFTVLTIDPPGHGDYRHRPMAYPDCLSAVPAAVAFLRARSTIDAVGVIGISLGGALTVASLARQPQTAVKALVLVGTPVRLHFTRRLFYTELWHTVFSRAGLSLLREMTLKQVHQTWHSGGYRSRHSTAELFERFRPAENIGRLQKLPVLLVYSRLDHIAPPAQMELLRRAAPQAEYVESKKASHVLLTLIPDTNRQIVEWLRRQLLD